MLQVDHPVQPPLLMTRTPQLPGGVSVPQGLYNLAPRFKHITRRTPTLVPRVFPSIPRPWSAKTCQTCGTSVRRYVNSASETHGL